MSVFWPGAPQRRARGNLRRVLSDLNQEIGEGLLILEGETVALDHDDLWCDVAHPSLPGCQRQAQSLI